MTTIKQKLKSNQPVIGGLAQIPSPIHVNLMAKSGFDFLAIDMVHVAIDIESLPLLFQAMAGTDCLPMVRLHTHDPLTVKRVLDAGAKGLIIPMVDSAELAQSVITASLYPPKGKRGIGFCNANRYGSEFMENFSHINDELVIVVQIESVKAVSQIDAIFSISEIDAMMIGPYDLSGTMGKVGQFEDPKFCQVLDQILAAAKRHGVAPGIHVVNPDTAYANQKIQEGYRFIAYSMDGILVQHVCREHLTALNTHNQ